MLKPDQEVTITFESIELMFFMLFQTGLAARGVLAQLVPQSSPSGSPSDLSRSLHLDSSKRPQ